MKPRIAAALIALATITQVGTAWAGSSSGNADNDPAYLRKPAHRSSDLSSQDGYLVKLLGDPPRQSLRRQIGRLKSIETMGRLNPARRTSSSSPIRSPARRTALHTFRPTGWRPNWPAVSSSAWLRSCLAANSAITRCSLPWERPTASCMAM